MKNNNLIRTELFKINPELLDEFEEFLEDYFSDLKYPFSRDIIENFYSLPSSIMKTVFSEFFKILNGEELTSDNLIGILVKFKKLN